MGSFQAKIGWKRQRKREIKIIVPFRSYSTCNRKFPRNSKKFKKPKKIPLRLHFTRKYVGKD